MPETHSNRDEWVVEFEDIDGGFIGHFEVWMGAVVLLCSGMKV
jgi:hypothetical protein